MEAFQRWFDKNADIIESLHKLLIGVLKSGLLISYKLTEAIRKSHEFLQS